MIPKQVDSRGQRCVRDICGLQVRLNIWRKYHLEGVLQGSHSLRRQLVANGRCHEAATNPLNGRTNETRFGIPGCAPQNGTRTLEVITINFSFMVVPGSSRPPVFQYKETFSGEVVQDGLDFQARTSCSPLAQALSTNHIFFSPKQVSFLTRNGTQKNHTWYLHQQFSHCCGRAYILWHRLFDVVG